MASFEQAFEVLIKHEGSYTNDPDDSGGETKFGISKRSYPEIEIKTLTLEKAKEIYKHDWWDNMHLSEIKDQNLANKIFDIGVNIGRNAIVKCLQTAINEVCGDLLKVDGIIGAKTINACNSYDTCDILDVLMDKIAEYYLSISKDKYIKGWLARAYS